MKLEFIHYQPQIINMKKLLKSKTFHAKYRTYFLNFYEQSNGIKLLEVTESKVVGLNKYERTQIKVLGEDIEGFLKNLKKILENDEEEKNDRNLQ